MTAGKVAIELTIVAGRDYVVPLDLTTVEAILSRFGGPLRNGERINLDAEPPEFFARSLASLWMHEIAGRQHDEPWNVSLADGSNVSIRPDAVSAVIGRVIPKTKGMGFGSIESSEPKR